MDSKIEELNKRPILEERSGMKQETEDGVICLPAAILSLSKWLPALPRLQLGSLALQHPKDITGDH